jgi:hypothetical protein
MWADAGGQSGLAAGDAICQAAADSASLPGTFRAWLSDDTSDAYCHIQNLDGKVDENCGQPSRPTSAGPWVRTDGFPFGGPILNIVNGIVYAPVRYDEKGVLAGPAPFFSGTTGSGTLGPYPPPCSNWTSDSADWVNSGTTEGTTNSWTDSGSVHCYGNYALLCMQTGSGPELPSHTSAGKKVFPTSLANGNLGGLAGADTLCQNRASTAGLANASNFKAWLSDDTTNAKDRIATNGPWVRLDGVKVADNRNDLVHSALFTAINVTDTGGYLGGYLVWTGTAADGLKGANNCNNWTSGTSSFKGDGGNASMANGGWTFYWSANDCNFDSGYLYCFED